MADDFVTMPVDAPAPVQAEAPAPEKAQEAQKPSPKETPIDLPKALKLVIDGKEEELPIEEVKRLAQLNKAGHKKFEEAAKLRREAEEKEAKWNRDLKAILREKMASNPETIKDLEDVFAEYIEQQRETPEQKEQRTMREQLEEYKRRAEEAQKSVEQRQFEELQQKSQKIIGDMITGNLKDSGLPQTPYTVKRVAEYMSVLRGAGYSLEQINMKDVVHRVRSDYNQDLTQMIAPMDGDMIIKLFGDDLVNKIRKADLARLKAKTPSAPRHVETSKVAVAPKSQAPKFIRPSDFDKELANIK